MTETLSERIFALVLSVLVLAGVAGCAGVPQRRGGPPLGKTNEIVGGAVTGQTGPPGITGAGTLDVTQTDLGFRISSVVAGVDGIFGGRGTPTAHGHATGVSTLVIGNMALVGIAGGPPGGMGVTPVITNLEGRVRTRVHAAFPHLSDVFITTDPALVSRIARITEEIQTQQSTVGHLGEIFAIANEMTGQKGGAPVR